MRPTSSTLVQTTHSVAPLHLSLRSTRSGEHPPTSPGNFLDTASTVACHRDPGRWNLLYRILWRLQSDKKLLHIDSDPDVAQLRSLAHQVRHDLHKMHAFVRFRQIEDERGETHAPQPDQLEGLWLSYYASIFNPARTNPELMRSHMPVRYWRSLPEIQLLPHLLSSADSRVESMVMAQSDLVTAQPYVPPHPSLSAIRQALPSCRGCDLYRHATQAVSGKGKASAALMLIGEQPGDQEDLKGEPFVGPAGQMLRKALDELSIDAKSVYMTNAVKHFKFVQRGKLRLHQKPRMSEINACRPWLEAEIDALKPKVILCLGASAAKAVLGGTFALMRDRGRFLETRYSPHTIATVHPSAILRAQDKEQGANLYNFLKEDLQLAQKKATE